MWGGSIPPIPTCSRCGAQREDAYCPVIQMKRPYHKSPPEWYEEAWSAQTRKMLYDVFRIERSGLYDKLKPSDFERIERENHP